MVHLVVPTVECNAVVVDLAMIVDEPVQMPQTLVTVHLVLVCHDDLLFLLSLDKTAHLPFIQSYCPSM